MTRTYPGKKKKAANPYTPEKPNFDPDNQAMGYDSVPKGSKKRSLKAAEEYESDGGFVANDNGDEDAPKSKKPKTTAAKGKSAIAGAKKGGDDQGEFWESGEDLETEAKVQTRRREQISDKRRITIDSFKGNMMVNIREYYEDKNTGNMMPGKKGISLPLAQYSTFLTLLPEIESALAKKGEKVPRPDFSGAEAEVVGDDVSEGGDGEEAEEKEGKKNFEATSEEE
ncbi:MAG: hypothetical protein LQ343_004625 [Gyalolechia ehrenbergii]|nr:MAG: hypothetical protein LQ343_004625 [Gyalolechia ehrenbergii]